MADISYKKLFLGILAFVVVSFAVQFMSHFVINERHFSEIGFMRQEPIMALGIVTMLIQGAVLSYVYSILSSNGSSIAKGLTYGLLMGVFLVSYVALVEPSKYAVPSVIQWISVEGIAGLLQFSLFGLLIGMLYSRRSD